jgi:dsRNA-specific ribonuclease
MKLATKSWEAYKAENGYVSNATLAQWAKEYNFDKITANELNMELM